MNDTINFRHSTQHITLCYFIPTKWRSYCDHRLSDATSTYLFARIRQQTRQRKPRSACAHARTDRQTCIKHNAAAAHILRTAGLLYLKPSIRFDHSIGLYTDRQTDRAYSADFHRAMVATSPREKLLLGRRPVRNWTRRTMSSLFFCAENYICPQENQQKLLPPELHRLTPICIRSSVCWGFGAPDPTGGAYSAPPDPLTVFRGPTSNGRGEERKGR